MASKQALRGWLILVGLLACFAPCVAHAQLTLDRYSPAPVTTDGFALSRPDAHGHLSVGAQLQLDYARNPLVYESALGDAETVTNNIVHKHLVGHLLASLSIYDRAIFYVHVPVSFIMSGDRIPGLAADGAGLQNIGLGARLRLYGEYDGVFALGLQGQLGLPSSDWADKGSVLQGEQKPTFRISLLADIRPDKKRRFHITPNIGAGFRKAEFIDNYSIDQELLYGLGLSYDFLADKPTRLSLYAEWYGNSTFKHFAQREHTPMEALGGVKLFRKEGFMMGVGAGGGLTHGVGTPSWRVIGMLGYMIPPEKSRDRDHDGIVDAKDRCPAEPEDKDNFEDTDGCPDPDNDGDGILDAKDKCPNEAEDKDGFQDEDGCPDPDNDGDGILDANDKCPNEAEDKDGFQDEDGCPDPDNDGDGILDASDKCPNEAEDKDGFEDEDGCPDPDNDQDGVLDLNDQCPLEAENVNGRDDEDGCPDKIRVDRATNQIQILEPVRFATGSATILPASFEMLGEIVEVLKAHGEIALLGVEGHTDSKGNDAKNQKLSDARANSVRDFLLNKGIDGARVVSKGYGETRPVADNSTEDGRQQNRRVEFHIGGVSD
jgi:outer membrane protein OmpA-like peptidoglycan-associated protein